jgi:hypothetical protein
MKARNPKGLPGGLLVINTTMDGASNAGIPTISIENQAIAIVCFNFMGIVFTVLCLGHPRENERMNISDIINVEWVDKGLV